jgi:hypothetical protein
MRSQLMKVTLMFLGSRINVRTVRRGKGGCGVGPGGGGYWN